MRVMSFNYLNPASVRANFRQAAIDTFSLSRFVRESLMVPASKSPTGAEICFDSSRVSYFGHSQGGITGALAAAFESDTGPWIFSGAGGGIAITAMERNDFVNIKELLKFLLYIADTDEPMTEMHPTVRLLQTLGEVTDPVNYSPAWFSRTLISPPRCKRLSQDNIRSAQGTFSRMIGRIPINTKAAENRDVSQIPPVRRR